MGMTQEHKSRSQSPQDSAPREEKPEGLPFQAGKEEVSAEIRQNGSKARGVRAVLGWRSGRVGGAQPGITQELPAKISEHSLVS